MARTHTYKHTLWQSHENALFHKCLSVLVFVAIFKFIFGAEFLTLRKAIWQFGAASKCNLQSQLAVGIRNKPGEENKYFPLDFC